MPARRSRPPRRRPRASRSGLSASGSRDSATWRMDAHSAIATSGTLIRNASRHDTLSTSRPPTIGPKRSGRRRGRPQPERPGARRTFERRGDDRQRARHEEGSGSALEEAGEDQELEGRGEAAQHRGDAEAGQADDEDPPPAVDVGQGPGDDQQGREDRQVAAVDVGLALEDAEETTTAAPGRSSSARCSRSCRRGRRSPTRGSPRAGSSVGLGSVAGSVAQARICSRRMPGRTGRPRRIGRVPARDEPRSMRACSPGRAAPGRAWPSSRPPRGPDGEDVFERWAAMGVAHFAALGAEVEPVLVRDRVDADDEVHVQAIGEADLIYLSGGKPGYLSRCSTGRRSAQPSWRPTARRGPGRLLGRGDGPGGRHFDIRRRRLFWPLAWRAGLGLVPNASVMPHYDAWPEPICGPPRDPGAARAGRRSASTRRPSPSAATARGRSTAAPGSPSGAAAAASATVAGTCSGCSDRSTAGRAARSTMLRTEIANAPAMSVSGMRSWIRVGSGNAGLGHRARPGIGQESVSRA